MIGAIDRHILLSKIFNETPFLCEVYAKDFDFADEFATFICLTKYTIDPTKTVNQLNVVYPNCRVNVYFITDYKSVLLENTKLIWREGKFYVR